MHRVLVAAVSVVVSAVVLAGCALVPPGSPPGPEVTSPGASGLSVEPTATPAVPTETALVYFVRDSTGGLRLGREERQVPAADPVAGAVQTMLAGPVDPDYTNPWPSTAAVIAVTTSGDVTTVNLNTDAWPSGLDARTLHAMADQLVWTVTEQTGADGAVALQIDGRPVGEWGDLTWSGNLRRAGDISYGEMRSYFVQEKVMEGRSILGLYPPTDEKSRTDFAEWRKAKGR